MNEKDLEYHVKSISETLESANDQFNHAITDTNDALKIRVLCRITGELSGALVCLQDEMDRELKYRKSKKFWQFWK